LRFVAEALVRSGAGQPMNAIAQAGLVGDAVVAESAAGGASRGIRGVPM
jgi:hypothetical protein